MSAFDLLLLLAKIPQNSCWFVNYLKLEVNFYCSKPILGDVLYQLAIRHYPYLASHVG
jgi:hypothetical protein